jgi:hypothetical protein
MREVGVTLGIGVPVPRLMTTRGVESIDSVALS